MNPIKCDQCYYVNSPSNHFCGGCGKRLTPELSQACLDAAIRDVSDGMLDGGLHRTHCWPPKTTSVDWKPGDYSHYQPTDLSVECNPADADGVKFLWSVSPEHHWVTYGGCDFGIRMTRLGKHTCSDMRKWISGGWTYKTLIKSEWAKIHLSTNRNLVQTYKDLGL